MNLPRTKSSKSRAGFVMRTGAKVGLPAGPSPSLGSPAGSPSGEDPSPLSRDTKEKSLAAVKRTSSFHEGARWAAVAGGS